MTTYIYLRVSTNQQDINNSLDQIKSFCEQKHFTNLSIFRDKGFSGAIDWKKRTLNDIIHKATKGDRVVVSELSRLGRSMIDVVTLIDAAFKKKVSIYTVKDNLSLEWDRKDPMSTVQVMAMTLASEMERKMISERVKAGMANAARKRAEAGLPYKNPGQHHKKLTDEKEDELVSKFLNNILVTPKQLSIEYNISVPVVYCILRRKNVTVKRSRPKKPKKPRTSKLLPHDQFIMDALANGKKVKQIAQRLECNPSTLYTYLHAKKKKTQVV
jgi:putative DNA-invertase from lambdoid prophage Rac